MRKRIEDGERMRLLESLAFGVYFLIFNLFLISMLEDPIQKLVIVAYTICIIIGAIILAIVQSRNKKVSRANNGKGL